MKSTPTRVSLAVAVVLLLLVGGLYAVRAWEARPGSELERALDMAPDDTARYTWTDWSGVREELGAQLTVDSSADDVEELLSRGFDADLTSTSALVSSAGDLQERFGFSPATARWELLSQSEAGMSLVVAVDPDDLDGVAAGLRDLGYAEPSEPDGTWDRSASSDATAVNVTPELAYVSLDRDRGLVIGSDSEPRLDLAVTAVGGDQAGVDDEVDQAARTLEAPLTAVLSTGDEACRALAMAQADPTEVAQGDALLAQAGEADPLTGYAIGGQPGGDVEVVMTFETDAQARTNAETRARLARGDAPGQGGTFAERFDLGEVAADGTVVTMDLEPVEGAYVLSDLSAGPVLFATC